MTKGEAIESMLRWLDEATINGQSTPPEQIADLKDRAAYLLDGAVKYIAGQFRIPAVHTVVRAPIKNLLSTKFRMFSGMPPDMYEVEADGGKSFYIEVYGDCTVTITSGASTLYSQPVAFSDNFGTLKANVPDAGGKITLSVASTYPFVVRNVAVYPCAFASDAAVQDYIPYVPYELPEDFREFDSLLQTSDRHEYRRFPDYRREGLKTFLLPYDAEGEFDFHYWRNPADIPVNAPDDTVIEVESHAAQLVPLKLAVDLCLGSEETAAIGHLLDAKFQNMLINLLTEDVGEKHMIEAVYTMI